MQSFCDIVVLCVKGWHSLAIEKNGRARFHEISIQAVFQRDILLDNSSMTHYIRQATVSSSFRVIRKAIIYTTVYLDLINQFHKSQNAHSNGSAIETLKFSIMTIHLKASSAICGQWPLLLTGINFNPSMDK